MGSFHTLHEFVHMGGYALYIWSAYFFVLVVFVAVWCASHYQLKKLLCSHRVANPFKEVVMSHAPEA